MNQIILYGTVSAVTDTQLADAVNKLIREGYQPFGGPFVGQAASGSVLVQAIVKYRDEAEEEERKARQAVHSALHGPGR